MLRAVATSDTAMQPMLTRLFPAKTSQQIDAILDDIRNQPLVGTPFSDLSEITGSTLGKKPSQSQSPGFVVSYTASDPRDARRICEAITSKIVDTNLVFIAANAKGTVDVLTQALEAARLQVVDCDSKIAVAKKMPTGDTHQQANLQTMEIEFESAKQNYQSLLAKKYAAALTAYMTNQAQGERMREIQQANLPEYPDFPNILSFLGWGFLVGLVFGFILLIWTRLRPNVRQPNEPPITRD
jgi:hypothetical protein